MGHLLRAGLFAVVQSPSLALGEDSCISHPVKSCLQIDIAGRIIVTIERAAWDANQGILIRESRLNDASLTKLENGVLCIDQTALAICLGNGHATGNRPERRTLTIQQGKY